jgi:glycosyltransferase involved in cell wall biosynthesis
MSKRIEIIFLTFNRLESNKVTLPAMLNSDPDIDYGVHIHDNNSTDGTVEWLKSFEHPKILSKTFSPTNLGIAPVTNKFWQTSKAEFIGKVDNDLIVPPGWMKEVLSRLEHAQKDKMGPVTLYHWIDEWSKDLVTANVPIFTTSNGSKIVRSSHTGGNYLMHRYLIDKWGLVPEGQGLKGGFTTWQMNAGTQMVCGYVYPLKFFKIPSLYAAYDRYLKRDLNSTQEYSIEKERREAKRLLELRQYLTK